MMIKLTIGYFIMGLSFLIVRFFYHVLLEKSSHNNLIHVIKNDFIALYTYVKEIILSNPRIFKIIAIIIPYLIFRLVIPFENDIMEIIEYALSTIMFFLLVIVFAPQEEDSHKGFPVEIFGFIYSIIFMFYSTGSLVVAIFYDNIFISKDVWIYGYIITIISYVICIATLKRFMEKDLSKEEIILLGMIMMITLEFITYYGIGFFGGIKWYDPLSYESSIFGDITSIINQGIFIASQSQILERSTSEIWGYIILNGTDVLTITAVLGYLVQKFMEI